MDNLFSLLPVTIYPLLPKNVKELRMRVGLPLSVYDGKKKTCLLYTSDAADDGCLV